MIEIEKIKEYTGGDEEFIAILFDKFLSRLDADLTILKEAAAEHDWKTVKSRTHAMLSSARIFFWDDIIELSVRIESDCDAPDSGQLESSVNELIALYEKTENEIQIWKQSLT